MAAPDGYHTLTQLAINAAYAADVTIQAAADAAQATANTAKTNAATAQAAATGAQTTATTANTAASNATTTANAAQAAASAATTAANAATAAVAAFDTGLRVYKNVSKTAAASPATGTGMQSALNTPRTGSVFAAVSANAETVTAPTALTVTVNLGYVNGGTFTPIISKAVPLATFAATNNLVNILGINIATATLPRWPAGSVPQITVTDGVFNFFVQYAEVPA